MIVLIIVTLIEVILFITLLSKVFVEVSLPSNADSIIDTHRIDSVELVIRSKDSVIYNIKRYEKERIDEANALDDSASVELFKRLLSK